MNTDLEPVTFEANAVPTDKKGVEPPDLIADFRRVIERDPKIVDPSFGNDRLAPFLEAEGDETEVAQRREEAAALKEKLESWVFVRQVIAHVVDHQDADQAVLSDLETPLTESLALYLERHIVAGREHKHTRQARFQAAAGAKRPPMRDILHQVLKDPARELVPGSGKTAKRLFDAMAGDRRISPGDLVVCTFRTYHSPDLWLALLKMDPTGGFVSRLQRVGELRQVVFEPVQDVLPTGELQKCAFVLPPGLSKGLGHDLTVLDQQLARYGARRQMASFFTEDFLQCDVGLNREDKTNAFVYGSREFALDKEEWTKEQVEEFHRAVDSHVQGPEVDVERVARQFVPKKDQDSYVNFLKEQKQLTDLVFKPDDKRAKRLTRYVWFEGVHGLKVRIDPRHIGPRRTLYHKYNARTGKHEITIRTITWKKSVR